MTCVVMSYENGRKFVFSPFDNINHFWSNDSRVNDNCFHNRRIVVYNDIAVCKIIERKIKVDILVSNPPYIKTVETIESSVYDFEPHVALFGGEDGLKFYREILKNASLILNEKGLIFFEMGYDLKEELIALTRKYYADADIEVYKDINGKDRMMMIRT